LPDETTKRAFRLLGVFGGKPLTFSLEAAAAMWGMEFRPAQKTMVVLVGRALVEPVDGGRYTLHTTLADFAESLLQEHDEAALARETHANYYLEFARKNAEKNWQGVEMEIGQIRRGFEWVYSMATDKQMVLDYEYALRTFFSRRGLYDEKIRWEQIGLELARAQGERIREARLLNVIGESYRRKDCWNEALEYFERSRAIYDEIGERTGQAQSLNDIGTIYRNKGLWVKALEYFERSRECWVEIGNRQGLANVLNNIGMIYTSTSLWDLALDYFERSRALFDEIGDQEGLAQSLNHIGGTYINKGLWDEALKYLEHSRAIQEEIGDRGWLPRSLRGIGLIYDKKGMWDEALKYFERSRTIDDDAGHRFGLALTLTHIGNVYEKQVRFADAEHVLAQAVGIFEELGSPALDNARKQLDKIRELQRIASQK
jgi:tetratricopeptide (TPR) repeat protein